MFLAHASAVAVTASQWNYPVNELLLSANGRWCAVEHITSSGGLQQITHRENLLCCVVKGGRPLPHYGTTKPLRPLKNENLLITCLVPLIRNSKLCFSRVLLTTANRFPSVPSISVMQLFHIFTFHTLSQAQVSLWHNHKRLIYFMPVYVG